MYALLNDIKSRNIKTAYLLYGDERYLVLYYRNKLVEEVLKKKMTELSGDMNFTKFSGTAVDVKKVDECAKTMPFFSERRVILLEGTGWFAKSNDEVAEFLKGIPDSACVIFVETEVDKRTSTFKAIEKCGHAAFFPEQKQEEIQKWICANVNSNYQKITNGAVDALIKAVGLDMAALSVELEKLYSYCMDKECISRSDVEELCHVQAEDRVFDMIALMAMKKRREALLLYYDLLELKESPTKILSLLERQFRMLIAVKDLRKRELNKAQIADKLGIKPFVVEKCLSQVDHFSMKDLKNALADTAEYDRQSKLGGIPDRMAVELILIKYSEEDD